MEAKYLALIGVFAMLLVGLLSIAYVLSHVDVEDLSDDIDEKWPE